MLKIGVYGAKGRMGELVQQAVNETNKACLGACFDLGGDLKEFFKNSDVIIDFSQPKGTKELAKYASLNPLPLVVGTTGLDEDTLEMLKELSCKVPVLYSSNMSLGMAVLNRLCEQAAKVLRDFDVELVELHHKHKVDAPSGSAMTLASNIAKARGLELEKVRVSKRDGFVGERKVDEIGVMSLRGGSEAGRHTVGLYSDTEYLELTHNASKRELFASGALKAALWLSKQKKGMYSINDCLGL